VTAIVRSGARRSFRQVTSAVRQVAFVRHRLFILAKERGENSTSSFCDRGWSAFSFRLGESSYARSILVYDLMGLLGPVEPETGAAHLGNRRRREWKTSVNPDTSGPCTDSRAPAAAFEMSGRFEFG
jgi:hypothetical protein